MFVTQQYWVCVSWAVFKTGKSRGFGCVLVEFFLSLENHTDLGYFLSKNKYLDLNQPLQCDCNWRPLYQMTLVFILLQSSVDKSPFHILFNIFPYSGSSLKQLLLSNIIIALMQLSQCLLDELKNKRLDSANATGSSWRKSLPNIIENPQKVWFCSQCPSFLHQMFEDFYHLWMIPHQ